jgi:aquaporin Z
MTHRKFVAEALGTAVLVIVGVGAATLSFGFRLTGLSISAGVAATALAFGLVLLALAYTLGPVSGANVNPAVTIGFVVSGRMSLTEAAGYWGAQFVGGIAGALVLWGIFSSAPVYSRAGVGLGTNGWGRGVSILGIGLGGAFATEVLLTFIFVFVVLVATSRIGSPGFAGLAIGVALTVVHLVGIPLTGTSVNPARSLGPAIIVGHKALAQVWLFIVAPLLGGALAAVCYRYFIPTEPVAFPSAVAEGPVERTTATP